MGWKYLIVALITGLMAAGPVQAVDGTRSVLVLPFEEISANPSQPWMGQAISQSIVAELSQLRMFQPSVGTRTTSDAERARQAALQAGADYVVIGGYQLLDPQLRITGQIIAVETGEVMGGLKATGSVRDFFGMQDSLASQAKRVLRTAVDPSSPDTPATDSPQLEHRPLDPSGPVRISSYEGSTLQEAVRAGGVRQAQPLLYEQPRYTNYAYGYAYPHPGGYYGMSLNWGYPPPITSGYWPAVPRYYYWFPGKVIIHKKHPGHHHKHHAHSSASTEVRVTR